jgi:hypothetical protein
LRRSAGRAARTAIFKKRPPRAFVMLPFVDVVDLVFINWTIGRMEEQRD